MKKNILITFVIVVVALTMTPEESQAVVFLPDDCVENGTPQQRANCLWYLHIAMMHDEWFIGMAPNNSEIQNVTPKNTFTEPVPVYAVKSEHVIIWYPLRS